MENTFTNETQTNTGDYISELISMGYSSLARDRGAKNLATYKHLDHGLEYLDSNGAIIPGDITKCIVILKLMIDLREKIISSEEVPDHNIPNIHKPADRLNDLLVKSAYHTIKNGNQALITCQCEAMMKAADQIRNEQKIRGLGILDRRLKNMIGRLRKQSAIESVFNSTENQAFDAYKKKADAILKEKDLDKVGQKLAEMRQIIQKGKNNGPGLNKLLKYVRRYEMGFISRIKNQMSDLNKKCYGATLYQIQENIEALSCLADLEVFHQKKGITLSVKRLIKHIEQSKIAPIESALIKMIDFIAQKYSEPDWAGYVDSYDQTYRETEIFLDPFYDYTIKGLKTIDAIALLQEKKKRIKHLEIDKISHINYEKELETELDKLIHIFQNQSDRK